MRVGKGCGRCRNRHIRCVIPTGASACTPCSRLGRECQLDPRFQFKPVHHVYQKGNGAPARFDLEWDKEQTWVDVSQPVTFVLEAADGSVGDEQIILPEPPTPAPLSLSNSLLEATQERYPETTHTEERSQRVIERRSQISTSSPFTPFSEEDATLSLREASLMRYFIQKLAPWADICDIHSHFSTEVPRRALENPMVLKAILALSARHDAILANDSDWEASAYHGECLEMLIAALDKAEASCDENMLIAVVILRIYEELENNTDQKFHLFGSNRLVNLASRSAASGGVAEAVSWQFLRQAIYASVVQYQPLQLDMHTFESSSMLQCHDDPACANTIIFYCARILQLCCDKPGRIVDRETWCYISDRVAEWDEAKPTTWQPIRYQAPNLAADRPFPELWMISPPAVVGMQYYHSACIFLTLSDTPSHCMSDYEIACSRRLKEKTIAEHLVMVIGLSLSNESVENAYFMASHLLHRFGYCLRHIVEQQGALKFLERVEKRLGWRTSWMMRELEDQWLELAAFDSWVT
ncbi:Fungal transcriptional regulatory protein [Penicillium brevicompactum]